MPQATANSMISNSASQNGGTEMPAKLSRLIVVSRALPGRRAPAMARGKASSTENRNDRPISSMVLPSRGSNTSIAGMENEREKPKLPCTASPSQPA